MFTEKAQMIVDLAKDCAFALAREQLGIESLLAAVGSDAEAGVRLAECLTNSNVPELRSKCPELGQPAPCPGKLDLAEPLRDIFVSAADLAAETAVELLSIQGDANSTEARKASVADVAAGTDTD